MWICFAIIMGVFVVLVLPARYVAKLIVSSEKETPEEEQR